jgi:hypothetical protein
MSHLDQKAAVSVTRETSGGLATLIRENGPVPIPAETFSSGSPFTTVSPRARQFGRSQFVVKAFDPPGHGRRTWPPCVCPAKIASR